MIAAPPSVQSHRRAIAAIREDVARMLEDLEHRYDSIPPAAAQAAPGDPQNDALANTLSPSQVKCFLGCSARWWFKYGEGLPDPPGGSLVRGKAVHKMAEAWFRARLRGEEITAADLSEGYDEIWDRVTADASFHKDDDVPQLKLQGAQLARKYLDDVAPEITPAALEVQVNGVIGGVPVVGFIDILDVHGKIIDAKTAGQTPSGIDPAYAFQIATYRQLEPRANGEARLDTLVANKTPKLVTISYTVSQADLLMTQQLYPHVREGMREGLYFPNRASNLCSRKYCNFADACEREFGGKVE